MWGNEEYKFEKEGGWVDHTMDFVLAFSDHVIEHINPLGRDRKIERMRRWQEPVRSCGIALHLEIRRSRRCRILLIVCPPSKNIVGMHRVKGREGDWVA